MAPEAQVGWSNTEGECSQLSVSFGCKAAKIRLAVVSLRRIKAGCIVLYRHTLLADRVSYAGDEVRWCSSWDCNNPADKISYRAGMGMS